MRSLRRILTAASTLLVAVGLAGCGDSSASGGSGSSTVVKLGVVPALYWTAWTATPDALKDSGVKVEYVPFGSSADALIALQTGQVQMASLGTFNVAAAMAQSDLPFKMVAGLSPGFSEVLVRKGVDIKTWQDLRGHNIGVIRGATGPLFFQIPLAKQGIDIKETNMITLQSATDLLLALRKGDVDAAITFQPFSAQAVSQGIATIPDEMNQQLADWVSMPSDVYAGTDLIEKDPGTVQKIVDAYVGVWKSFDDKAAWVDASLKYQTGDKALLTAALATAKTSDPATAWWRMDADKHVAIVQELAKYKAIPKDTSDGMAKIMDYQFLAKSSGQTPAQLGQK